MPLEGQWARQNTPLRPTTRRERRLLASVAAIIAIATVIVVVLAVSGPGSSRRSCIAVTAASSMGGATLQACGRDAAQRWCNEEARRSDSLAHQVQAACRRAGYLTGP